jgi:hypothetical protein
MAPPTAKRIAAPSIALAVRQRKGRAKKAKTASAPPPPNPTMRKGSRAELDGPVVLTVKVDVTAVPPVIADGCVAEQVGGSTAPAGLEVTEQAMTTVPVNPPPGVMVRVEVVALPGATAAGVVAVSARVGVGGGVIT